MLTVIQPEPWVTAFSHLIPPGTVLDLACGKGRHGRYLLDLGYQVTFLDRDISGVSNLTHHTKAQIMKYDLENGNPWPFPDNQFSGIIVVNYLYRPLLPYLTNALKPNGIIVYKTFAVGNEKFGRPKNPKFLLQDNELLDMLGQDFEVIDFRQGKEMNPDRITQAICVRRPNCP
jgi:SAM-dependent methyltransferase